MLQSHKETSKSGLKDSVVKKTTVDSKEFSRVVSQLIPNQVQRQKSHIGEVARFASPHSSRKN